LTLTWASLSASHGRGTAIAACITMRKLLKHVHFVYCYCVYSRPLPATRRGQRDMAVGSGITNLRSARGRSKSHAEAHHSSSPQESIHTSTEHLRAPCLIEEACHQANLRMPQCIADAHAFSADPDPIPGFSDHGHHHIHLVNFWSKGYV
jgi:hypothetical protein